MGVGRRLQKRQEAPVDPNKPRPTTSRKRKLAPAAPATQGKKRKASGGIITNPGKHRSGGFKAKSTKGPFMSGALNDDSRNAYEPKITGTTRASSSDEIPDDDDAIDLQDDFEASFPDEMSDDDDAADLQNGFEAGFSDEELDAADIELEDGTRNGLSFDSEDDDSDDLEELNAANIEARSRVLDAEKLADAADAQRELEESGLRTNISGERPRILEDDLHSETSSTSPTTRSKRSLLLAPNLQFLRTRIIETVRVLESFSSLREEGRSRADYTTRLLKDISEYYVYSPYLAEKLFNLFSPSDAFAFFEANESQRPVVIRTNTLKTHRRELAQALIARGVTLEPVGKWSKVGLQIFETSVQLGATSEYLAGHYILQAASSFLPVMALKPQEHERILDMAAAPGGKTTHIAAMMRNTGSIFANDANKARSKALIGNIHRLGVKNTIVTNLDAKAFPKVCGGFDRVLLDAPCSGTGVISKDPSVKTNKDAKDFMRLPHQQKQLLLHAIDSVDHNSSTGAIIVYSTCSVTVEENEQVVQYALSRRPNVKIEDTGLVDFGIPGFTSYMSKAFDKDMKLAKRYYPHTYNVDGFFVCRLRKTGPSPSVGANGKGQANGNGEAMDVDGDETVEGVKLRAKGNGKGTKVREHEPKGDDFGGWIDTEDEPHIERALRKWKKNALGLDPNADETKSRQKGKRVKMRNGG